MIGTGYLGLTHAVCMAELGHDVLALDVDPAKVAKAASGVPPFFEPGLEPLLRKNLEAGRLRFTASYSEVGDFGEVHFLCIGTSQSPDGSADLQYVHAAVDALGPHLTRRCLVVGKSTVPAGTARHLATRLRERAPAREEVELAWNPCSNRPRSSRPGSPPATASLTSSAGCRSAGRRASGSAAGSGSGCESADGAAQQRADLRS